MSAVICLGLLSCAPVGFAAPATVTIDDRAPALAESDGGGWTASLGFTNLTDGPGSLTVAAATSGDRGCEPTVAPPTLPKAQRTTVKVTLPAACDMDDEKGIDLVATTTAGATTTFDVTAAPKEAGETPDWIQLLAFPISLAVLTILAAVLYLRWDSKDQANHRPNEKLKYLEATWSFKDSWVSNIIVAGGLLTGIFGSSEVVKALLGEEADQSIALATVGAAIAVAFTGAGPLVLLTNKARNVGFVTVNGLLASSVVTLTGAFGQLWVGWRAGHQLDLDGIESWLWIPSLAAALLLLWYAVNTILALLEEGTTRPHKPPPSDAIAAATMIVKALEAQAKARAAGSDKEASEALKQFAESRTGVLSERYPEGTSPGDEYRPPRRVAVL
jgi:uncharacterized membrane protein